MRALTAFLSSLLVPLRRPKLVFYRYLFFFALASLLISPLAAILERNLAHSVTGQRLAEQFLERAWIDLKDTESQALADFGKSAGMLLTAGLLLSFTLVSGGTLWVLADRRRRSSLGEFCSGAGRLFFPYLRLGVWFVAGLVGLYYANLWLSRFVTHVTTDWMRRSASSATLGWLLHGKTVLMLFLLGWLVTATGLAKARAVLLGERFMSRVFWREVRTTFRHPLSTVILAGIGPGLFALVVAGYALARDRLSLEPVLLPWGGTMSPAVAYLLLSQLFVLLAQAAAVIWCGSFLRFTRSLHPRPAPPPPEPARPITVVDAVALAVPFLVVFAGIGGAAAPAQLPEGPWNNRYRIQAELDPKTHTVSGSETVVFTNLGDTTVDELRFHLYPNAFSSNQSVFMTEQRLVTGRDRIAQMADDRLAEELGYCHVESLQIGGQPVEASIEGTVMRVPLEAPLAPGQEVAVDLRFRTKLPRTIARMGHWEDHYDVMQWFPKLGVFRDGEWECEPFHASTEFFADFGDYDVTLLVPSEFVVGATGVPVTPEVEAGSGLAAHRYVASAVHDFAWCADRHFVEFNDTWKHGDREVRLRYLCQPYAQDKRQAVFAATKKALDLYAQWFGLPYPYDALTIDGLPYGLGGGMEYPMLFTISQSFPSHLPLLSGERTEDPASVTVHEFGHQYWYGILASNEVREAWLDEGVNTYVTTRVMQELFPRQPGRPIQATEWSLVLRPFLNEGIDLDCTQWCPEMDRGVRDLLGFPASPFVRDRRGRPLPVGLLGFNVPEIRFPGMLLDRFSAMKSGYYEVAARSPIRAVSHLMHPDAYGSTVYGKTALALATLENTFGWEALREALRAYVERYQFQHPTGDDFLNVLREVIPAKAPARDQGELVRQEEVDLYLHELFETAHTVDFAVARAQSEPIPAQRGFIPSKRVGNPPVLMAEKHPGAATFYHSSVLLENRGQAQLPVEAVLVFENGTKEHHFWDGKGGFTWIETDGNSKLASAQVDPDRRYVLDLDLNNNGRTVERNAASVRLYKSIALYWAQNAISLLTLMTGP